MPRFTIDLDEKVVKVIDKRAKKNLFSFKEQLEDIIRRSAVSTSSNSKAKTFKTDDRLVEIFSRDKRGRKKKTKK